MDPCASHVQFLCTPNGAFIAPETLSYAQNDAVPADSDIDANNSADWWSRSPLNPQLRIDSLELGKQSRWQIDGSDAQGTQFFVRPTFITHLVPRRIDVFIPDQSQHPPQLRHYLGSSWAFSIRDHRINGFDIARLLKLTLDCWLLEKGKAAIEAYFRDAPYGSRIVFANIDPRPQQIKVNFVEDFTIERRMLSVATLQSLWQLPSAAMPRTIGLEQLQLLTQLHDTVALVQLSERYGGGKAAFKSSLHDVKYMYHELKLLLSMESSPNIIPRPLYLVTEKDRYGGADRVYGFLLPYLENGNLANYMGTCKKLGTLSIKDQLKWSKQVVRTLQLINKGPAKFYSELKTDNLLLSNTGDIVFIDFEQMGNWGSVSAPEIHYFEFLKRLASSKYLTPERRDHFAKLLADHEPNGQTLSDVYNNPVDGYYTAWTRLPSAQQEAAEVYSLGKLLWCIFEGCPNTRILTMKAFKSETELVFPEFRQTPPPIQSLINQCTEGGRDWEQGRMQSVRIGDRIFPGGQSGRHGEPLGTLAAAINANQEMWKDRVRDMEQYFDAWHRWRIGGSTSEPDRKLLGFMHRPTLQEVLTALGHYEEELNDID